MRDQDEFTDHTMTGADLTAREHKLHGIEVFPGVGTPLSRTTRYGATFVAVERGRTPLIVAGWVNYTPIFFKPGTECIVVGGRWCLIERGRRRVALHGTLGAGTILWNDDGKLALLSVRLRASGGTGPYRNYRGDGELSGVLNHHPFPPSPPSIGATLRFSGDAQPAGPKP
jgi:hypothetical protein